MSELLPEHEYIAVIADAIRSLKDDSLRSRFIKLGLEYISLRVEHDRRPPPSAVDVLHEKAKLADEFAEILIQIRDEDGDLYGWQDENQGISVVGMEIADAKEWLSKWEALSSPTPTDARDAGGV